MQVAKVVDCDQVIGKSARICIRRIRTFAIGRDHEFDVAEDEKALDNNREGSNNRKIYRPSFEKNGT